MAAGKNVMCVVGENWEGGGHVHMAGVCGTGMAGLAFLLAKLGWRVSGCDAVPNALREWLERSGVPVARGHDPAHLAGVDRLVVTAALDRAESEVAAALAKGVSVLRRGEVLAALVSQRRGVAVCGTHGKTTTACFTARLFQELGDDPGWCIGGATRRLGGLAGGGAGLLVVEADESDGTLALYCPALTVLTNIDSDHMEHFQDERALSACFRKALSQTREGLAVCRDDARAWSVAEGVDAPVLGYGFSEGAELRACEVEAGADSVAFSVLYRGIALGRVKLGVSGRHNVLNALGAAAAALLAGHAPERVFGALGEACRELPGRRFECIASAGGISFVADYAHHPAELKAAVAMALDRKPARLVAVFQPHRYTRTKLLGAAFPAAFAGADEVLLLPVYAASERPLEGGDVCDLYRHFVAAPGGGWHGRVKLARSVAECWQYLRQSLRAGDLALIAGAGDVVGMTDMIKDDIASGWPEARDPADFADALERERETGAAVEPFGHLAGWAFFGVGGRARWRVEVKSDESLARVLRLCAEHGVPWRMTGMGANSWFSDLGEPGCVLRLSDGAARDFDVVGGVVEAGCGWRGPALLDRLERDGLSGLEFLEGVPGSLGGWLAMNAGAHGFEIGERVEWIRCLNPGGEVSIMCADECGFGYRRCAGLVGRVALACGLRLDRSSAGRVRAMREQWRARRLPLAGMRTEGSVFRNPAEGSAGRMLDAAGCKGMKVGGARVIEAHANVIAVEGAAAASDVLALAMIMRNRVMQRGGVKLAPEIRGLEF